MKNRVISRIMKNRADESRRRRTIFSMLRAAVLEPRTFEISHQRIIIPQLPSDFHGFRIVQLSDIHHSDFFSEEEIANASGIANRLQPHLIALTGDYVSHSRDFIPGCARALGRLSAPHGVYAVLGNHDHWTDGAMMASALSRQNIRVLSNENVRIHLQLSHIHLAGIDDLMVKRDDLAKALDGVNPAETRILLAHNPAIIRKAARAGVDLVLSGHTHGGQINWRLLTGREDRKRARWLRRPSRRMMRGLANFGSTQLYVNRGLGTVVMPLRYGCPPEITLIELLRH